MKRFDVIVIGGTRAGLIVADALAAEGKSVAVVKTAGDDAADRLMFALEEISETTAPAVRFAPLSGPAKFLSPDRLAVIEGEVEADRYVIAVGAVASSEWDLGPGPFPPLIDAFSKATPASATVLGAGAAAVVAADRLSRNGSAVTLIARGSRLLPLEDKSVSDALSGRLRARGVKIHLNASAASWAPSGVTRWTADGAPQEVRTDALFSETDLRPATDGLDLNRAGVYAHVTGRIVVNSDLRTSSPRIWAVGHAVSPGAPLAEQAAQAEMVANNVLAGFFGTRKSAPALPPIVIRTCPPAARVGMTEEEARAAYPDAITAVAPWFDNAATPEDSGLVKIVGRRRRSQILGAHILGPGAPETILFFDLLIRAEIPLDDVPDRRHFPMPGGTDAVYRALLAWNASASSR